MESKCALEDQLAQSTQIIEDLTRKMIERDVIISEILSEKTQLMIQNRIWEQRVDEMGRHRQEI